MIVRDGKENNILEEIYLGNRIVIMGFFTKSVAGAKVGIPCWLGRRRGKKREERKKRNTKSPHIFEKKKAIDHHVSHQLHGYCTLHTIIALKHCPPPLITYFDDIIRKTIYSD